MAAKARAVAAGWRAPGIALLLLAAAAGARAQETPPPKPGGDKPTDEITITGKKPPVEQGERSVFTDLPPRDLFKRPLVESPGLDTATSVVGQEQIRWLDAYSVVDALKYVPGAWTESRGRKVKQFLSVRGQRYPYPGYLVDGAWLREFHETNYFFNAANVERIEFLRSSAALLLSPGGMTGLVNIIPRTYTEPETRLDAVYGEDETWRTHLSHGAPVGEDLSYAFGLGYRHTDGPHNMNAEENIADIYARVVSTRIPELTLSLSAFVLDGDRELRLAEPPASRTLQTRLDSFDPMRAYMVVGKALYEVSDHAATEVTANFAQRRFHGQRVGAADWLEEDYEYGLRVIQSLKLSRANTLRFGGMFNQWVSPTGKRFYVGRKGDLRTWSGVVVDEHDFGRLLVNLGYRLSRTYINDFGGLDIEGSATGLTSVRIEDDWEDPLHTLTLGGSYALTDEWSLHGNASWGQLASAPGMLTDDFQRPGTETRTKLDLGIKRSWDAFGDVTLTGFYVHQQDAPVLSGGFVTVDAVDYGLYENADRDSYGVELDVRTRRFDCGLQLFANLVAMRTDRERGGHRDEDKEVPNIVVGGGVSYMPVSCLDCSLFTKHVSSYENERFLPGGSDPVKLGDFTELNAKVTYTFGKSKEHYAFFGVDNLTDKHYSTVAGYPDDGRRLKIGVGFTF